MEDLPPESAPAVQFADVDDVVRSLGEHGYLADERLATSVFLMSRLEKPLLLEGPAGVGKTELAKTLAVATGRRLVRLQCYEGQDETKALYDWDYGKQLLYTQILRDKIAELLGDAETLTEAVDAVSAQESLFFSERFLAARPLLEAIRSPEPVVLLIDEVDRADEALEAVLLELLAEFQVSVPEIGTFVAVSQPYVLLTSNNTRDLSSALKRRCLHLTLEYPDRSRELDIIASKDTGLDAALVSGLVDILHELRDLDLRKSPSISEAVDWARTLAVLNADRLDPELLARTISVVLKYEKDVGTALGKVRALQDPNRGGGRRAAPARAHGDEHDPDHPSPPPATPLRPGIRPAGERTTEGVAARAEKDRAGRHGNYYGGRAAFNKR
ncbi:MAG: Carbon monoxide oxidation accessory protein CoxD [uncultured Frankineae bacterium]|uniref:Carbon monoxide oxidation accessory protein CoxD n=1 Tax=uncultured Frankineae bacterium TaxID=437475 RepID=A0A6J4LRZ5_9ACTN|nr:MAG: Carbon monoxide oxidation accessory protein CoxD [uncultured Frankineae bacterium]